MDTLVVTRVVIIVTCRWVELRPVLTKQIAFTHLKNDIIRTASHFLSVILNSHGQLNESQQTAKSKISEPGNLHLG